MDNKQAGSSLLSFLKKAGNLNSKLNCDFGLREKSPQVALVLMANLLFTMS